MSGSTLRRCSRRGFVLAFSIGTLGAFSSCGGNGEPEELTVFREAMEAVAAGDKAKGMELLNECIQIKPSHYAYLERARLYMDQKDTPKAIDDCKKGLELDPENKELTWLLGELEKPEPERFKGPAALPPASRK